MKVSLAAARVFSWMGFHGWVTGFLVARWVCGWMWVSDCEDGSPWWLDVGVGAGGLFGGWMGWLVLEVFVVAGWEWMVGCVGGGFVWWLGG